MFFIIAHILFYTIGKLTDIHLFFLREHVNNAQIGLTSFIFPGIKRTHPLRTSWISQLSPLYAPDADCHGQSYFSVSDRILPKRFYLPECTDLQMNKLKKCTKYLLFWIYRIHKFRIFLCSQITDSVLPDFVLSNLCSKIVYV